MRVTIDVRYPSGQKATLTGDWYGLQRGGGGAAVMIDLTEPAWEWSLRAGVIAALDPRCVCIMRRSGLVLYTPRAQIDLPAWVDDWLAEHPEWPPECGQRPE
jgi:hypothetical protein